MVPSIQKSNKFDLNSFEWCCLGRENDQGCDCISIVELGEGVPLFARSLKMWKTQVQCLLKAFKPPPPPLSEHVTANPCAIKRSGVLAILLLLLQLALIIKDSLVEGRRFRYLPSWRSAPGWEASTAFVWMTADVFSTIHNGASQGDWRWPTLEWLPHGQDANLGEMADDFQPGFFCIWTKLQGLCFAMKTLTFKFVLPQAWGLFLISFSPLLFFFFFCLSRIPENSPSLFFHCKCNDNKAPGQWTPLALEFIPP